MASKSRKKAKTKKNKKQQKKSFSLFGFLFKWTFVLGAWAALALGLLTAWYAIELPDITRDARFERKNSITIKAADGSIIQRYGEVRGESMSTADLPPHLISAVMAIEDRRFYSHFGLDVLGVARAMVVNIQEGGFVQGGSTITQQLAKNLFLSRERTIKRKLQEALLALWLESQLTKDEIMSAYLNRVYMGAGTYGVEAASQTYFGKSATQLDLREAALIAGLLKAPSRYSPTSNPMLARERTEVVLSAMVDAGYITEEQAKGRTGLPPRPRPKPAAASATRYYTDWVVDGVEALIGSPEEDIIIHTTIDPVVQQEAGEALSETLRAHGSQHRIGQGAVVVMRPDGAVIAMIGGGNYRQSQFNRAVQAKRQPGSSFKPFLYLAAIEQGWEPHDRILDAPFEQGKYRPKNFKDEYFGEVTLTEALTFSMNTAAVRTIMEIGHEPVQDVARRLGIFSPLGPDLSLALGTSDVSLLEMTTAYAVLANGGLAVFPYAITKITDENGTLYYQRPRRKTTRRVVDSNHVEDITGMMRSVVEYGTGRGARQQFDVAGKTGTSQESRDAWFIGFSDRIVAGVWLGNDDNQSMRRVTGGSFPTRIFSPVMRTAQRRYGPMRTGDFTISRFQALIGSFLDQEGNAPYTVQNHAEQRKPPSRSIDANLNN